MFLASPNFQTRRLAATAGGEPQLPLAIPRQGQKAGTPEGSPLMRIGPRAELVEDVVGALGVVYRDHAILHPWQVAQFRA